MSRYPIAKHGLIAPLLALLALAPALPAHAADGPILITQEKAIAGNVTPGDTPGFPVTLSLPGSYILASNLQPPAGKAGIKIASNEIAIDLNGFRLNGASVATTGINGAAFESITIRNGTITGFDAYGLFSIGTRWIVEDMRVVKNGAQGIHVGDYSTVRGTTVTRNGSYGINCGFSCLIEDSNSSQNGAAGVVAVASTVLGNVIINNAGLGITGIFAGSGNNTLVGNNGGAANPQVDGAVELHPNACFPACP